MQETNEFDRLLSAVTHEIRNPVTLINSYLQLLSKSYPAICDFTYWNDLNAEMERLKALLADLSSCSSASRLHMERIDLSAYLRGYERTVRALFPQAQDISFSLRIADGLPCVMADAVKLRQVLDNLVRNAVEAIESVRHTLESIPQTRTDVVLNDQSSASFFVRLEAYPQNEYLCISVCDNGCGIRTENVPTLFEPFVTQKAQGTGLGLSICRRIAQAHGGNLILASCAQPTEFRLLLPAEIRR